MKLLLSLLLLTILAVSLIEAMPGMLDVGQDQGLKIGRRHKEDKEDHKGAESTTPAAAAAAGGGSGAATDGHTPAPDAAAAGDDHGDEHRKIGAHQNQKLNIFGGHKHE